MNFLLRSIKTSEIRLPQFQKFTLQLLFISSLAMSSDILFKTVEKMNNGRSWGRFLDAGTGVNSVLWIQKLHTQSFTAITADENMSRTITSNPSVRLRPIDSLVVGNWMDTTFCEQLGTFDTILADYLIGAVDGFSPYEQDTIIAKLSQHLNPGGKLFVIGMNPIPDVAPPPADVVAEVRRARDACILLAAHRPYREFPLTWMKRHLELSNFRVASSKNFTILHSEDSIRRQIRVAQSKLALMASTPLRTGMERYLSDLDVRMVEAVRSTSNGRIPLSFDYVIAAELAGDDGAAAIEACTVFSSVTGLVGGGAAAEQTAGTCMVEGSSGAHLTLADSDGDALLLEALKSLEDDGSNGAER